MVEMGFSKREEKEVKKHPDYEKNLNWGSKFITNYNEVMSREMQLKVIEDVKGDMYHFEFNFIVPEQNWYANPITPNQAWEEFYKEFKNAYWAYLQLQRKWDAKVKSKENFKQFDPLRIK